MPIDERMTIRKRWAVQLAEPLEWLASSLLPCSSSIPLTIRVSLIWGVWFEVSKLASSPIFFFSSIQILTALPHRLHLLNVLDGIVEDSNQFIQNLHTVPLMLGSPYMVH